MNLGELGIVIFESQKGKWDGNDYENFVWKMTQLLDHDSIPDNLDLQDHTISIQWEEKH